MTDTRRSRWVLRRLAVNESGATVLEYALLVFVVSMAAGFLLPEIGNAFRPVFDRAEGQLAAPFGDAPERDRRPVKSVGGA